MSAVCIIPLGPDELVPEALIDQLSQQAMPVIVSAARPKPAQGSENITWIEGLPGRGVQLNRAIEGADAQWFWLLHADSLIPSRAAAAVRTFCAGERWQDIGYAGLQFAKDGPRLTRLNQWGANLRSHWLGQPYGDQGLCVHKQLWSALGGFSEQLPRGEDLDWVIRARALGAHPKRLPFTITTSARRYRACGWLKTTLDHQIKAWQLVRSAKRWQP